MASGFSLRLGVFIEKRKITPRGGEQVGEETNPKDASGQRDSSQQLPSTNQKLYWRVKTDYTNRQ